MKHTFRHSFQIISVFDGRTLLTFTLLHCFHVHSLDIKRWLKTTRQPKTTQIMKVSLITIAGLLQLAAKANAAENTTADVLTTVVDDLNATVATMTNEDVHDDNDHDDHDEDHKEDLHDDHDDHDDHDSHDSHDDHDDHNDHSDHSDEMKGSPMGDTSAAASSYYIATIAVAMAAGSMMIA